MIGAGQLVIDSATWDPYPVGAFDLALTYTDGQYLTPIAIQRQFRKILPVSVLDEPQAWRTAKVLDIEKGAATVDQARPFVEDRHARGWRAGIYCARDKVAEVSAALAGLEWKLLLATLDGTIEDIWEGIPVYLCQFTNLGSWDLSYLIGDVGNFFVKPR